MGWYYDYKPTIETDKGIKAKSKRGDFVKNWWATRWIAAMERVMDRGRLQRGRRYARKGQVLSLEEGKGRIMAKVQGSRRTPYKVTIELSPLSEKDWEKVLVALAERPYFVSQLLAGEMPQEIEEAFQAAKLDLFPSRRGVIQACSCPDSAVVCKHLAAVHYILAERFDEDPFLLFRLRGKTQEEILASLGTEEDELETAVSPEYSPASPLSESVNNFWQIGPELESFSVHIAPPEEPYPLLERLGEPDFFPESRRWLVKAFDLVSETVVQIAFQIEEPASGL
ncbi:MAG: hypothetical protein CL608_28750 [Anaerolineaceae bacterium]|nr:hypothetical protein [Anaerolineaceae bacterium]